MMIIVHFIDVFDVIYDFILPSSVNLVIAHAQQSARWLAHSKTLARRMNIKE
jgi:hypothetical protein